MRPGELIHGRFEILSIAGSGGMGTVYRAQDRESGATVAVKLVRDPAANAVARLALEARLIADLQHPNIVRYVAHGATEGMPYLAMEWLEGETLAERLAREGLTIGESVEIAKHAAAALGAAHGRGIIHRDVKPSNIFLCGRSVEKVKLLDFGIARGDDFTAALTQTGAVLGTPGYMAPEQARGDRDALDARTDVFSLGCVLFECLTGRPAFQGTHVMALLAKLLLEEPRRVRELRPTIPEAIDELVARMLAKQPADRPRDGAATLVALEHALTDIPSSDHSRATPGITGTEVRIVSVVVALAPAPNSGHASDATLEAPEMPRETRETLRREVERFGGQLEELANGMMVALLTGSGIATDQATVAARCALRMRELLPDCAIALITGRSGKTGQLPIGEVLDRAALMLVDADKAPAKKGGYRPVRIDEVTRALLDVRFHVDEDDHRILLMSEGEVAEEARTLLGRPTPFVGRNRELKHLVEIIEEGIEESSARALLVTGEAGMGKSRLRYEMTRRLRTNQADLGLGIGRGDPSRVGSAFALLAGAFRSALGIALGEPLEARRNKLAAMVDLVPLDSDRKRIVEFLGEFVGAPFPDETSPMLKAARQNAAIMADQIQAAYLDFMRALLQQRPVLLILEDLHWADAASVRLVDAVLRDLKDRPFIVVAFARLEVHEVFPKLWSGRDLQEIRLRGLSASAGENLVRSALGTSVDNKAVSAIVGRAGGNAFYMEELIRSVAAGNGDTLPETVLGMVEARLAAVDTGSRKLLRAASVFGEIFWAGGVLSVLGQDATDGGFARLVEREFIVRHAESRLANQEQFSFRHALIREGAYAMLTERDCEFGHKLAGEWLESAGEQDARVLATHFDKGAAREKAAFLYLKAARQTLHSGDASLITASAAEGLKHATDDAVRGALYAVCSEAYYMGGDYARGFDFAIRALACVPVESPAGNDALGFGVAGALFIGRPDAFSDLLPRLLTVEPSPGSAWTIVRALQTVLMIVVIAGQHEAAAACMQRIDAIASGLKEPDPLVECHAEYARAYWLRDIAKDFPAALAKHLITVECFERVGARSYLSIAKAHLGICYLLLGQLAAARAVLDDVLAKEEPGRLAATFSLYYKSLLFLKEGRHEDAYTTADSVRKDATAQGDVLMIGNALLTMSEALLAMGRVEEAELRLDELGDPAALVPYLQARLLSLRAEGRRLRGRAKEAVELGSSAYSIYRSVGMTFNYGEDPIALRYADALYAAGEIAAARVIIGEAAQELGVRAERIFAPELRRAFLENLPEHARICRLVEERSEG